MPSLPPLAAQASPLSLPLADGTAVALEAALLSDPPRGAALQNMPPYDPALLVWALCQAQQRGVGDALRDCVAVTKFLTADLLTLLSPLAATPHDFDVFDQLDEDLRERAAELAERSYLVASVAAGLAEAREPDVAAAAWLLGLTHDAAAWFALAGDETPAAECLLQLPIWHRACLAAIAAPADTSMFDEPAVPFVREAIRLIDRHDGEARDPATVLEDWADIVEEQEHVGDHWRARDLQAAWRLGRVVARLARLEELETKFDRAVEFAKVEAVRQLAYGAGHEINNPLANISARAQTLAKEERDPQRKRRLAAINAQAFRAHEMIADLMLFSRPPALQISLVELAPLVEKLFSELAADAATRGTTLRWTAADPSLTAEVDALQISVALKALCVNSLEALGAGGSLELTIQSAEPDGVEIVVADDGPGIPPDVRPHIFDPFYSGREAGRGLGFGLSKCWRIITEHGGRIEVESELGSGARFRIKLLRKSGKRKAESGRE